MAGTPSPPGMWHTRTLPLPSQQTPYLRLLLLPGHRLRHHLLQPLDKPGKHPGDQKPPLDLAAEAFAPTAAAPLATIPRQKLPLCLPAAVPSQGLRDEGGHWLWLLLGRCRLHCSRDALGGRNAAFWLCPGFSPFCACSGLFRKTMGIGTAAVTL